MSRKIKIGLVGLGFGKEFIPIHQAHPNVELVALCRRNEDALNYAKNLFKVPKGYVDFEDLIRDSEVEAIHINSPIADHADQSLRAIRAGKHVLCTVPMATTIDECEAICRAVEETGLKYMMAETAVYAREFLFIKQLYESGDLGKLQYLAASHTQDMDGWPSYWKRMIPMHYATHIVGPCLGLINGKASSVSCFGSGKVRDEIAEKSGNSFAVETAHITIQNSDLIAHIWRFLYDVARQYRESFDVYGSKKSFEWTLVEGESHIIHTAKCPESEIPKKVKIPDYAHLLPSSIRPFTQSIEDEDHRSFVQGGGHGGSHPHMIHEFVSAIIEDKSLWLDAKTSANWTCVGICAHKSAQQAGAQIALPAFTL